MAAENNPYLYKTPAPSLGWSSKFKGAGEGTRDLLEGEVSMGVPLDSFSNTIVMPFPLYFWSKINGFLE